MPGLFISYRRSDNPDATGRIYDRLVAEFGREKIFKDIDSIPLGRNFRTHLNETIGTCDAVLAIVGPRWVDAKSDHGQRRLDDPDDFVRIELEAALARNIPVVPVLVGLAPMPAAKQLPSSLAELTERQSIQVRPDPDFHADATRLVAALRSILDPSASPAQPKLTSGAGAGPIASSASGARATSVRQLRFWQGVAVAAVVASVTIWAWHTWRPTVASSPAVMANFNIDVAPAAMLGPASFFNRPIEPSVAISPDGTMIVFAGVMPGQTANARTMLYRRPLASANADPLAGTEGAANPFFSPDGQWVAYVAGGKMRKVALAGGPSIDICDVPNTFIRGHWGESGLIAFTDNGLKTVPATGGTPQTVLLLQDPDAPSATAATPPPAGVIVEASEKGPLYAAHLLPGGRTVIFTQRPRNNWETAHVDALDLQTRERKTLLTNAADARYLPSGHLVFMRKAALLAVAFDSRRVEVTGEPTALVADVMQAQNARNAVGDTGAGQYAISQNGTLVYASGGIVPIETSAIVSVDRTGVETKIAVVEGNFYSVNLSVEGRRVLAVRNNRGSRTSDLWLFELSSGAATRITTDEAASGLWAADGRSILYQNLSPARIMRQSGDARGDLETLVPGIAYPTSVSADGMWLLYGRGVAGNAGLFVRSLTGKASDEPFARTGFPTPEGYFSPDGKWVVYRSSESGESGIYVQPFPGPGEKRRVSVERAINPAWSRDGKRLFYLRVQPTIAGATRFAFDMIEVDVTTGAGGSLQFGEPRKLFGGPYIGSTPLRSYDVTADGRFIMVRPEGETPDQRVTKLTVILGWGEQLRRRMAGATTAP